MPFLSLHPRSAAAKRDRSGCSLKGTFIVGVTGVVEGKVGKQTLTIWWLIDPRGEQSQRTRNA